MKKIFSNFYMVLVYLFLYCPIFVLIAFSFNASKSRAVWTGFTVDWYKKLFHNEVIMSSLLNTLIVALIASVAATIIGTVAAIGIYRMKKLPRAVILNISYLPIINPEIIMGVSLMLLFVSLNMTLGYVTLILAHITFCVPYVILNVLPKLRQMDRNIYDAASDLGCTDIQVFFKVVLPEIMPGVLSGFLISVTYSIDDFVISYFTSGATSQTLPITIFSMTRRKVSPEINALSALIFVVVLLVLLISNFVDMRKHKREEMALRRSAEERREAEQ